MDIKTFFNDRDQQVYESELKDWLPEKIFDAHVHLFEKSIFGKDHQFSEKCWHKKFNCAFTLEQYKEITDFLLPDQDMSLNCFGLPELDADMEANSKYIGEIVDNKKVFGMAVISPKDDIKDVKRRIKDYHLVGYKPYRNFVDWKDYEDVTIFDMLSPEQMEFANENSLVITLHIPKAKRLADSSNQKEMVELCRRYPKAKIVFAHIGRAYYMNGVVGFLDSISKCENAYIDTAMVNHPGVLEYAFNHFPRERMVFGTDSPIAFFRGKSVEINNQYAYLMGEDYAIGTSLYDADHVIQFTTFYYEQLRGIKEAAMKAGLCRSEREDFFYNNMYNLVRDVQK
ncbi:MAG: amidohydrolase family protein [Lentisphaeria bacterium]